MFAPYSHHRSLARDVGATSSGSYPKGVNPSWFWPRMGVGCVEDEARFQAWRRWGASEATTLPCPPERRAIGSFVGCPNEFNGPRSELFRPFVACFLMYISALLFAFGRF